MTALPHQPIRTCVGCFQKFPKNDLLSVTRLKNGSVIVDVKQKISGRSVYLCHKKACLDKARERKGQNTLQYGLKLPIPPEVWAELETILKN